MGLSIVVRKRIQKIMSEQGYKEYVLAHRQMIISWNNSIIQEPLPMLS